MTKPKGHKTMRKPPKSTDLDSWIKGKGTSDPATQQPENSEAQEPNAPKPDGPGIVQRADGTYRRRLVVYLNPEHADQLKMRAVIDHRDMSDIVDELLSRWLASKSTS